MKPFISFCIALIISSCASFNKSGFKQSTYSRSIVKIQSVSAGGKQNLGSGVVIAPNTIATNCHVMRRGKRAFLIEPDGLYPVLAEAALPEFDVCILKTEYLKLPAAELSDSNDIHIGDDIVLSGYPLALNLRQTRGKVTALHPYRNDHIIEINTGFNHGASGGGVFDSNGKLLGLMTFMGSEAGIMHFYAIPATWLSLCLEKQFRPLHAFSERSFWEKGEFVKTKIYSH